MVKLGDKVVDSINGFCGVASARAEYLYGCVRVLVEPSRLKEDGSPIDSQWVDEQRLTLYTAAGPGGPQKDAPKA